MIDKIIRFLFYLLFFLTPLIMMPMTSELFEFNKMLFIYLITVLVAFFWLLKMVISKKIILKKTFLDIPIILFLISQIVSTVFSLDRHTSLFGYYGRFNGGLISILSYIILYYGLVSNSVNIKKLLKVSLWSSVFVCLWGMTGKMGHDLTCLVFAGRFDNSCWDNETLQFQPQTRTFSTLGQPNWLGAYLAVTFFIGLYFLIKNKIKNNETMKQWIIMTIYLFLNFSMILFSRSRSALFAVLFGVMLFISYYLLFIKINAKKILLILFIIIFLPILFFKTGVDKIDKYLLIETYKNVFVKKQYNNIAIKKLSPLPSGVTDSFDIRKIVWQGAIDLGLKYPLFGTGVETFAYSYYFVRPIAHNLTSEWDYVYNKAHNEYLNYLATTGFVGLGSYLLFIFCFVIFLFKKLRITNYELKNNKSVIRNSSSNNNQILYISLFVAWLTILITNFFGFSTTTINLFFYLIPGLVFLINCPEKEKINDKPVNLNLVQKLLIFFLLSSTIYFLFSITIYFLADINYSNGLKYANPQVADNQKAASFFEKALKLRYEHVYEDRLSSSLAYLSALAFLQKENDIAQKIAVISDSYNRKTIEDSPKNIFYWKTRAKNMFYFYQITGNKNELTEGVSALLTAQKLSPTDPKIPYSLALYYSQLLDIEKNINEKENWKKLSLEEINKSIKLKTNYRDAFFFKGQLLKKYGEIDEARKTFEYILKNFDKNDADVLKEINNM
jgi:O-antigen ligase